MEEDKWYIVKCPFCGEKRNLQCVRDPENKEYFLFTIDIPSLITPLKTDWSSEKFSLGFKIEAHCEKEYYEIIKSIDEIEREQSENILGNFDINSQEYENYIHNTLVCQKIVNELSDNFHEKYQKALKEFADVQNEHFELWRKK